MLYQTAARHDLKHILLGTNVASEAINAVEVGLRLFRLQVHPARSTAASARPRCQHVSALYACPQLFGYMAVRRIRVVPILDFVVYDKAAGDADDRARSRLGSTMAASTTSHIYTRFYQAWMRCR